MMDNMGRHKWSWHWDTMSTGHWECDLCGVRAMNESQKKRGMGPCRGYKIIEGIDESDKH